MMKTSNQDGSGLAVRPDGWRSLSSRFSMCLLMLGAVVFGLVSSNPKAQARYCTHDSYGFNGSTLQFEQCGKRPIIIRYQRVHASAQSHGITSGAKLFVGRERVTGALAGTMWVYKRGCEKIGFIVRGSINHTRITLRGRVPVRGASCDIIRTRAQDFIFTLQ